MVNKALKKYSRVDAKYSDSDKEYILENWGSIKLATIANKLCRTPKGIIRFTERNKIGGFSKTHEYLSTTEVANMFGVNPSTVINYWVGKYGLEHIRQKINKRELIRITLDDLLKWCEDNQDKYNTRNLKQNALGLEPDWLIEKRNIDRNTIPKRQEWDEISENTLLRYVMIGLTNTEISQKMGRTAKSISRKKCRLIKQGKLKELARKIS